MKQDERIVLKFLTEMDKRIGKIRDLPKTGRYIPQVGLFLKQIAEATDSIRKQIQSGLPYGAQLIHLFRLNEQMHWSFFLYYRPRVHDSIRRGSAHKASMAKKRTKELRQDYSRHLARICAIETIAKIEAVADQIKEVWEQHFDDEKFPKAQLSGQAPSVRTIRRYVDTLFPHLLRTKRQQLSATISIGLIPLNWDNVKALRDAQGIKTIG
jgi:hypothetical protein